MIQLLDSDDFHPDGPYGAAVEHEFADFIRGLQVWQIKCGCNTTDITQVVRPLENVPVNKTYDINFDTGQVTRHHTNDLSARDNPLYTYAFHYTADQYDQASRRVRPGEEPRLWYSLASMASPHDNI